MAFGRKLELGLFRNRLELRDMKSGEQRTRIAEHEFSTESSMIADDDCLKDEIFHLVRDLYQVKSLFMYPSVTVVAVEFPLTKVERKAALHALSEAGFSKAEFADGVG